MPVKQIRIALWLAVALASAGTLWLKMNPPATQVVLQQALFKPEFALPDAEGKLRRSGDFRGQFQLVFFGFTTCPDVCPMTLAEVATVMDELGQDAAKVQPIFISIDPERDRALGLAKFTQAFHPSIIGLAGDNAWTRAAADSFKIHFAREDDPAASGGYTMSHTPGLFLIGPEGDWIKQYTYGTPAQEILADLKARL